MGKVDGKKGTGTFCRNGPKGAAHKTYLSPFSRTEWDKHFTRVVPGSDLFLLAKLDEVVRWARKSSLWPMTFGLACCAIEMMATGASRFDLARFGAEVFRPSPRQADLLVVSGRLAWKMSPVMLRLYDQMAEPKYVISMGACASSGGVFSNYSIVQGVDQLLPVHMYVPGCPPRPEMLLDAIMKLQERIQRGEV